MFKVFSYRRKPVKGNVDGKFVSKKLMESFSSLEAARNFVEGKSNIFIEYQKGHMEMQRC